MTHAFDTSLSAPHRTIIQAGIVSLLSGLKRPMGYLAAVEAFGLSKGWQSDDGQDLLYQRLLGRMPAILVVTGDSSLTQTGASGFDFKEELEVMVYFANNNERGVTEGRLSADAGSAASNLADPGLHVMMAHARELIIGQYAGAAVKHGSIKQIRPEREEEVATTKELSLWMQTYRVTLASRVNPNRGVTQLLRELRTRLIQEAGEANLPTSQPAGVAPPTPLKPTTLDTTKPIP